MAKVLTYDAAGKKVSETEYTRGRPPKGAIHQEDGSFVIHLKLDGTPAMPRGRKANVAVAAKVKSGATVVAKSTETRYIYFKNPAGHTLEKREYTRGRPPKGAVENGIHFIVTVDHSKDNSPKVTATATPKVVKYLIMHDTTGKEISREPRKRGRAPRGAVEQPDGNYVLVVDPNAPTSVAAVSTPKVPVVKIPKFLIMVDDKGTEISREPRKRGRAPKGAVEQPDGNYVLVVKNETTVVPTAVVTTVTPPVVSTAGVVVNDPVAEVKAAESATKPTGSIDMSNPVQWTYDLASLVGKKSITQIEAKKQYPLIDIRACISEINSISIDGKIVMFSPVIVGTIINETDLQDNKGDGWHFNSAYAKMIIDVANNAILVWKVVRDSEPDFVIRNVLQSDNVSPVTVEEPVVIEAPVAAVMAPETPVVTETPTVVAPAVETLPATEDKAPVETTVAQS